MSTRAPIKALQTSVEELVDGAAEGVVDGVAEGVVNGAADGAADGGDKLDESAVQVRFIAQLYSASNLMNSSFSDHLVPVAIASLLQSLRLLAPLKMSCVYCIQGLQTRSFERDVIKESAEAHENMQPSACAGLRPSALTDSLPSSTNPVCAEEVRKKR